MNHYNCLIGVSSKQIVLGRTKVCTLNMQL